jgi:hypothetical protein
LIDLLKKLIAASQHRKWIMQDDGYALSSVSASPHIEYSMVAISISLSGRELKDRSAWLN